MKNYYNQSKELEIAEVRLESLEERLKRIDIAITNCTSQLSEDASFTDFSNDKMDKYLIRKEKIENEISILKDEIAALKKDLKKMENALRQMNGMEEQIFVLAHISNYKPQEIARKIPCGLSTVYRYLDKINKTVAS